MKRIIILLSLTTAAPAVLAQSNIDPDHNFGEGGDYFAVYTGRE